MPPAEEPGVQTPGKANRDLATFLILFLLAFLPYSNIFLNQFVYDDGFQVVENPYAHSFKYLRQIFTTTVWSFQGAQGVTNYYRPMMTFGYLLTYKIAGLVPFGFHLVNILLEAIAVWLVFAILRRLSGVRVAFVAAGLFALHPIHTEAVDWIAAVTDLELAVFYLGTFLLYIKLPETKHKFPAIAAMCGCFALALLSKEQAMTLPILVMIFEYFYRDDRETTTAREKISRYAALWIVAALYLTLRFEIMGGFTSVIMRPQLSWYEAGLSAVALLGAYMGKLIWPARLSAFYVFQASQHFSDPKVLLGLGGIALCAIIFAALWKRAHTVSLTMIWFFLPLGPVLNARWMPAGVFGERYLYLPSIGFCWLLAWVAVQIWSGNVRALPRIVAQAAPALLGLLALAYGVALLDFGQCAERLLVGGLLGRPEQAPWPELAPEHHVDLGGVERHLGAEMQPHDQRDHERELSVGVARVAVDVIDVQPAHELQDLPAGGGERHPGPQAPRRDGGGGQEAECGEEQREVHDQ